MQRVPYNELLHQFERVLLRENLQPERARFCARIFADNTRDGVYSHGLARFAGFVANIRKGIFHPHASPTRVGPGPEPETAAENPPPGRLPAFEQWDGHLGLGPVNAWTCMDRAVRLARENAVGCVGLARTNHWMRAGTYGLQAADSGCIGVCWTNTNPLMPPYGSAQPRLGNNPLVLCVPRRSGEHVLLDMAMSQFSMGRLATHARRDQPLPVPGGYDPQGNLTTDAAAIRQARHAMPMGFWKGAGLALVLDLVAALLAGGQTSCRIGRQTDPNGASQVFIAIDLTAVADPDRADALVDEALADLEAAEPTDPEHPVAWPGKRMYQRRRESLRHGVLVEEPDWNHLLNM